MTDLSYWSRRRFLRRAGAAGAGAAGLALAACSSSNSGSKSNANSNSGKSATQAPAASAASGGAAAGTAAAASNAAASATSAAKVKKGGTLTVAKSQDDPPKLDPTALLSAALYEVNGVYMEPLLSFDLSSSTDVNKKTITPVLAASWEQPDKSTAVFKLDPKATWHEIAPVGGGAVTSKDVKATMDRLNDPAAKSPLGALLKDFVDSYEATDPQTVTVKLKRPFGALFEILAAGFIYMMPEMGAKSGYDLEKIHIGSGAFTLKSIETSSKYVYAANPRYRREVYLDGIEQVIFKDPSALNAAILARQLHLAATPQGMDLTPVPKSDYNIFRNPGVIRQELAILRGTKPFDDQRVRQAFKAAIDQQEIVTKAYNGDATTAGIIPYSSAWALPKDQNDKTFAQDLAKAKQLLQAAGVSGYDGQVEQSTVYGPAVGSAAEVVAAQLAKVGIKLNVKGEDHPTFLKNQYACSYIINSRLVAGNTGNGLYDWTYKNENTNGLYSVHNCDSLPGGADQKLNDMTLRAVASFDQAEQQSINVEFQQYMADVVYFVPMAVANQNHIALKSLQGWGFNTSGAVMLANPFLAGYWINS